MKALSLRHQKEPDFNLLINTNGEIILNILDIKEYCRYLKKFFDKVDLKQFY